MLHYFWNVHILQVLCLGGMSSAGQERKNGKNINKRYTEKLGQNKERNTNKEGNTKKLGQNLY